MYGEIRVTCHQQLVIFISKFYVSIFITIYIISWSNLVASSNESMLWEPILGYILNNSEKD